MREVFAKITRAGIVDDALVKEIVRDIQRVFIQSDVNVALVQQLSREIEKRVREEKLPPGISRKEQFTRIVYDELVKILGGEEYKPRTDPHKILLVGLFGSGKTTTTAKLAKTFSKRGLKTAMITTDIYRPAAFTQLSQLGEQVKTPVYGNPNSKKPLEILEESLKKAGATGYDILIVDSAGRDSLNKELLDEIKHIHSRLKPEETYLVISADIGQTATAQARAFHEAIGLTGVIVP